MPVIDDLGADHERLLARSSDLRRAIADGDRATAHAELGRLVEALRRHTAVEESSVFAGLRAAGEMLDDIDLLAADHAAMWSELGRLESLSGADWDAAVVSVLDDLRDHITREDYDVFPATLLAIGPAEWDAIETAAAEARS